MLRVPAMPTDVTGTVSSRALFYSHDAVERVGEIDVALRVDHDARSRVGDGRACENEPLAGEYEDEND